MPPVSTSTVSEHAEANATRQAKREELAEKEYLEVIA
jgi:hypothetical protein